MDQTPHCFSQFDQMISEFFLSRTDDMALISKEIESLKEQIAFLEKNQEMIHHELQVIWEKYEEFKKQLQSIFNESSHCARKVVPSNRQYIEQVDLE